MSRASRDFRDPAERAWQSLLGQVPRREPPAGFSARLMDATRGSWPELVDTGRPAGVRTEVAVTAGVVAGAAALTLAPVVMIGALFVFDAGVVVEAVARTCVLLVNWLSAGVSLWDVLARAGRVAATAMASPAGTLMLLVGTLTAWIALAGLSRVIPAERETSDA
jgi:hypothetical protein